MKTNEGLFQSRPMFPAFSVVKGDVTHPNPILVLRRLAWLRIVVVLVLVIAAIMVFINNSESLFCTGLNILYGISAASILVSMLTWLGLRARLDIRILILFHITWNLGTATAWLYATGGAGSLFSVLYLTVVIESSVLLGPNGTVAATVVSGVLYWLLAHLEAYGIIVPFQGSLREGLLPKGHYPFSLIVFTLSAMFLTAMLSSYSREKIKKTKEILQETTEGIQDLQAMHEHIVRSIHSGLVTVSLDNRITSFNHAAERITEFRSEEVIGRPVQEVFGPLPDDSAATRSDIKDVPPRWEQRFRKRGGKELPLGFSTSALRDHRGKELGQVFVFQDLTAYKQMEDELKRADRMAAIGELAAGLAHEIRNPLASLYGSVEILKSELSLKETHKRLMEIVLNESERLNELITGFLQFANPAKIAKEPVQLRSLVEETLLLLRNGPEWRDDLSVIVDIPLGLHIYGNRKQIEQILWNLFLNAVQAMPHRGEIRISARARHSRSLQPTNPDSETIPVVEWSISDTGTGIEKEHLDKIFNPFFTTKEHGSGLGLAVVYRIIEKHGGRIRVESTIGKGTTFWILLPQGHSE